MWLWLWYLGKIVQVCGRNVEYGYATKLADRGVDIDNRVNVDNDLCSWVGEK